MQIQLLFSPRGAMILMCALLYAALGAYADASAASDDAGDSEWKRFKDSRTGNEVWQLTQHEAPSEAFYFYAQSFTADDRYVIFRSRREGVWDAYRSDLTNGVVTRLTVGADISRACMYPDGEHMAYIADGRYYLLHIHRLETKLLVDLTDKLPAPPSFRPSFTRDGRYTLVGTREEGQPPRLYRLDLETGELLLVLEGKDGGFSHELINPVNPNLIAYAPSPDTQNDMTLPLSERPRARLINVSRGTDEPYLIAPYGFRATHDSWSPLGDRYFFFEKTQPGWTPVSVASIDLQGEQYTRHYTDADIRLGHGAASADGKWFVMDSQLSHSNPLLLLNLEDGKTQTLCWPDASVNTPARVHVHPNFSASGNFVIYTSDVDKTDTPQVYVVPIKAIKEAWSR